MNITKNTIIILTIVALIALSGCTGSGGSAAVNRATQGMVINSFTFSPSKMVNGEEGSMVLEVQNVGGTTATDVKAFLYNIDSVAYFAITESGAPATDYLFGDMTPPDMVNNIPSFPESIVFTADNNGLEGAPEGIPITFEPKVRVCYLYETTATAEFTVISADELRQQTQRGVYKESPVITSSSGGPLGIDIMTPQPIKANAAKEIRIQVKVRNLDKLNGLVFEQPVAPQTIDVCMNPTTLKDMINRVTVSLSIPDLPAAVFADQTVRLLKGDGAEGTATFKSNAVDLSGVVQKDFHIVLTASYGYFVESQTGFILENEGI